MGGLRRRGLPLRVDHLFRVLLRHVEIQSGHRGGFRETQEPSRRRAVESLGENMATAPKPAAAGQPTIELRGVNKWYGEFHVLKDINLTVNQGQKVVVCGPSGSGKSTMIRCINRLEEHQQGDIIVDGIELTNDVKNVDAIRREVGMV